MKRLRWIITVIGLLLLLLGCAPQPDLVYAIKGKRPGELPFVAASCAPDRSVIYVYWPNSFMNAHMWCFVSVDDVGFREFWTRTYISYDVAPGAHVVSATKHGVPDESLTTLSVNCEPGQATYVQVEVRIRLDGDYPKLTLVPASKGAAAIAKTKQPSAKQ